MTATAETIKQAKPKRRRWLRWCAVTAGVLAILYLALSFVAVWKLTHRLRPMRAETAPPAELGIETVRLNTADGQALGAWLMPGRPDQTAVILLHGIGGTRGAMLPVMNRLHEDGHPALAITLRGHGDSTGQTIDFGYSSRADLIAGVDFLRERFPSTHIVVSGTSLGAAAAMYAARELGDRVDGYMLESPYRDLETATRNRLGMRLPSIGVSMIYPGLRMWGRLLLPFDSVTDSPCSACVGIPGKTPVVILTGARDRYATLQEAKSIEAAVSSHGQLIQFAKAGHANLFRSDPEKYYRALTSLVPIQRAATTMPTQ